MLNKQKGITLIALVITIIVLLILAGVTIAAITGNESAPNKAVEARQKNEEGAEFDAIKLAAVSSVAEGNLDLFVDIPTLISGIQGNVVETNLDDIITGNGRWTVTGKTGKKYLITNGGDVKSYIPTFLNENNSKIELTNSNAGQYYGKTVATVNINNTDVQFGLFYVDFAGKYGESGTIYLRAKSKIADTAIDGEIADSTNKTAAENKALAVEIMKDINPDWASDADRIKAVEKFLDSTKLAPTLTITSAEKGALYLCNPNNSIWSSIKTDFETICNKNTGDDYVNYVIGAPSVEMFLDSYNAKYNTTTYSTAYNGAGVQYTNPGYLYSNDGGTSFTKYFSDAIQQDSTVGAMYRNTSKAQWLASPLSNLDENVMCHVSSLGWLSNTGYSTSDGVAPIVSLKAGVDLTISTTTN